MKAVEYFSKYESRLTSICYAKDADEFTKLLSPIILDFDSELKEIIEKRKAKCNDAVMAVIKELNQRFNIMIDLHTKKYKTHGLAKDLYIKVWEAKLKT